jgi:hypothetical protein
MRQRNLLYTGITRGKRLVVLVGQKKAIAIASAECRGTTSLVKIGPVASPQHVVWMMSLSKAPGARRAQAYIKGREFVAGLAQYRLCLRRAGGSPLP